MRGDDFAFAATESELRKMRSRMCEWYDVKVRGILGTGKRDVRKIEILATSVKWTEEGLESEASDRRRQALLEGLGSIEESKTVNSAAVEPEEIGQEEDGEMLEGMEKTRFRNMAATLNFMSLDSMRTCNTPRKRYARRWRIWHEEGSRRHADT